jgi:hypothetical protein
MADLTEQQLLSTDPDVLGLQRQRKLAELLTGQAFNAPQGQMISGRYVKPSNLQQALPMISAAIGGLTNANLDTKQTELAAALRNKQQEAMQNYIKASQGTPAQMYPQQAGPMPSGGNIPQEVQTAATGPNYGEMFKAGTSQYASPQLQAAAYKLLEPIHTKEGETITQRNLGAGGGMTPISVGGVAMPAGVKEAAQLLGITKPVNEWNPQELAAVNQKVVQLKQAGANNVNVNTGQHGFENTMKLGESFKSEPIYKAHQEIRQAYEQVNNSLNRKDAAGDMAAAIKINKMLDPTSVVKESEAARIAASRGIIDTLGQLNAKITKGESLTPQQRTQYKALVKDFYDISGNQYNETRNKYDEFGRVNQLVGTETMLGAPWKPTEVAKPAGGFNVNPSSLDAELKRRGL